MGKCINGACSQEEGRVPVIVSLRRRKGYGKKRNSTCWAFIAFERDCVYPEKWHFSQLCGHLSYLPTADSKLPTQGLSKIEDDYGSLANCDMT